MARYNNFEQVILDIIKQYSNVPFEHEKLSVRATEVMKQSNNNNKIFTDTGSPYCTEIGNQKRTEFVFHSPVNNIDWRIECKSRKTQGLLGEILIELNYVALIPEKLYCLVLSNVLITPNIINLINTTVKEKNLSNKVWVGSAEQFENLLKESIKL